MKAKHLFLKRAILSVFVTNASSQPKSNKTQSNQTELGVQARQPLIWAVSQHQMVKGIIPNQPQTQRQQTGEAWGWAATSAGSVGMQIYSGCRSSWDADLLQVIYVERGGIWGFSLPVIWQISKRSKASTHLYLTSVKHQSEMGRTEMSK